MEVNFPLENAIFSDTAHIYYKEGKQKIALKENVLWPNIAALWHMNNDWTDTKDGNNGTGYGGVTFTTDSKLGSHAGLFDGIDDYVSQPLDLAKDAGFSKISIEAWIYAEDDGVDEPNFVIEYFKPGIDSRRFIYVRPVSNWICFALGNTGYAGNFNLWGQWVHVVMTGDGSTIRGYVNGNYVPIIAGSDSYIDASGTGWIPDIGRAKSSADRYFKGRIDELIIYNKVLSESEISERYNNGAGEELWTYSRAGETATLAQVNLRTSYVINETDFLIPCNTLGEQGVVQGRRKIDGGTWSPWVNLVLIENHERAFANTGSFEAQLIDLDIKLNSDGLQECSIGRPRIKNLIPPMPFQLPGEIVDISTIYEIIDISTKYEVIEI